MELFRAIAKRRSVRAYTDRCVEHEKIVSILTAGMQAPSGKNGQPWKFIVIQKDRTLLQKISALTVYDGFVRTANCLILIFLDKTQSYAYLKDAQAIGASIQNMLLAVEDLGLAACWIGEILNRDLYVRDILKIDNSLDLMAMLAVGYPVGETKQPRKKTLKQSLIAML